MSRVLPRGIDPELLVSQIKNTMPYLLGLESSVHSGEFAPKSFVLDYERSHSSSQASPSLSHFEYFRLCVSAHYLTCGTPVPTDVDNQIRHKLWPSELPLETALQMAQLVLESRNWDFRKVTTRFVMGAAGTQWETACLSGHLGEWFTLAGAAYCALRRYTDARAKQLHHDLFESIANEVNRHAEIFGSLWRSTDGVGCLKASACIAHNFGDLDRVLDMWGLALSDPLSRNFYKLTSEAFDSKRELRFMGRIWAAGQLYKSSIGTSSMAKENHRHFALRKPRCLRQNSSFLIPIGPFFDDWGKTVARGLAHSDGTPSETTIEVAEALYRGWERLPGTWGYGRALVGFLAVHPDLPVSSLRRNPAFQKVLETTQSDFEREWNDSALNELEEIPSRA